MSEYGHVRVYLDPLGLVRLPDGSYRKEIELMLSNDPDRDPPSLADAVCSLDVDRARHSPSSCWCSPGTLSTAGDRG